jgi:hypothetical protein
MKLNFVSIEKLKNQIPNCNTLLMSQKTYDENINKFKNGYYNKLKIEIAENADDNKVLLYCSRNETVE